MYLALPFEEILSINLKEKQVSYLEYCAFELKKNATGRVYFVFKDHRSEMIAVSQSFPDRASLETCISHIRNSIKLANIVDANNEKGLPPLLVISLNNFGRHYFYMLGFQGERLMSSEGYDSQSQCLKNLHYFKNHAPEARLIDFI